MLSYEGLFFENESRELIYSLEKNKLARVNPILHCTFKFNPNNREIFNELVGKTFDIYIIGYGNDGMNSGFEILLPNELKKYYINYDSKTSNKLKTPHITTSLAEGSKAVNTKNLTFKRLEKPIKVTGKFGFWIQETNQEYISYKPYYNRKKR